MDKIIDWFQTAMAVRPDLLYKVLASLIIILILWLLHRLVIKLITRRTDDVHTRYRSRKTSSYISFFIGFIIIGLLWFRHFQSVVTFLGLLSAGLAIALRDLVANLAAWVFILARRPLEVGDRIQIGENAGDVIDTRVFEFTLMEIGNWVDADQSTGRIIHIPNSKVFSEALANYGKGFKYIWNEIAVLITFESNWEEAKGILLDIARKHAESLSTEAERRVKEAARKFLIFYTKLTPTVYTSVRESGVLLTVRYLCEPRRRRGTAQAIWEDILREFKKYPDIDFAYPTQRFYQDWIERKGKPNKPK